MATGTCGGMAGPALAGACRSRTTGRRFFGGSAWTWDAERKQFYMHTFLPEQPDYSIGAIPPSGPRCWKMVRRWLDRGVDGFRLDVFNAFFKHADLLSNPRNLRGRHPSDRQVHLYDKETESGSCGTSSRSSARSSNSYPERMTVGELFSGR